VRTCWNEHRVYLGIAEHSSIVEANNSIYLDCQLKLQQTRSQITQKVIKNRSYSGSGLIIDEKQLYLVRLVSLRIRQATSDILRLMLIVDIAQAHVIGNGRDD
jgi:hypothetical protein